MKNTSSLVSDSILPINDFGFGLAPNCLFVLFDAVCLKIGGPISFAVLAFLQQRA